MIGIIGAMRIEVDSLKESLTDVHTTEISGISYHFGKLSGVPVVVAVSGVGKVFAAICAQTMILKFGVKKIINIGVAGAIDPRLKQGDVAVSSSVCQYDVDTTAVGDELGMISGINVVQFPSDKTLMEHTIKSIEQCGFKFLSGVIATGDKFVAESQEKQKIHRGFKALVADMESGSIAQVCYVNKIPFVSLRVVSDNADAEAERSYFDFLKTATERAAMIVKEIVKSTAES